MNIKKPLNIILLSTCLMSISTPVFACSDHNHSSKSITSPAKTASVEVTKTTEKSLAYIKNIFQKNNKNYVVVDFITLKEATGSDSGGISNNNPKLRTFELSKSFYWTCQHDKKLSIDNIKTQWIKVKNNALIYSIATEKGQVTSLYVDCAG